MTFVGKSESNKRIGRLSEVIFAASDAFNAGVCVERGHGVVEESMVEGKEAAVSEAPSYVT